jgi:copper resistance protein B
MEESRMFTKQVLVFINMLLLASPLMASGEHKSTAFHAFTLEASAGENRDNESWRDWHLDGWVGGDKHKLWIKSEGHEAGYQTENSENWLLYSRNVSTFWDAQIGLRDDNRPESTSYLVMGLMGLAPYSFDTEAHLFVSQQGDVSLRIREENNFLLNQKWILKPYIKANWFAQDVSEQEIGSGLSSAELGLQLRYEITRKFAPYLDIRYERLFGDTASFADASGKSESDVVTALGLRLIF